MSRFLSFALCLLLLCSLGCTSRRYVTDQIEPVQETQQSLERRVANIEARLGDLGMRVKGLSPADLEAAKKANTEAQAAMRAMEAAQQACARAQGSAERAQTAADKAEKAFELGQRK